MVLSQISSFGCEVSVTDGGHAGTVVLHTKLFHSWICTTDRNVVMNVATRLLFLSLADPTAWTVEKVVLV